MIIKDMPESERPREKMFMYGPAALSNAEIVAILIGSGSRKKSAVSMAQDILAIDRKGLGFLGECTIDDIMSIEGIGMAKACQLMAAVELGKRLARLPMMKKDGFDNPEEIADYFMATMRYLKEEHLMVLLLDSHGGMISVDEIGIGSIFGVEAQPRDVFCNAVKKKAAAIVVAHNHPSGDCTPSMEDREMTQCLGMAGELLGIPLLDHLVIGDGRYSSIKYIRE